MAGVGASAGTRAESGGTGGAAGRTEGFDSSGAAGEGGMRVPTATAGASGTGEQGPPAEQGGSGGLAGNSVAQGGVITPPQAGGSSGTDLIDPNPEVVASPGCVSWMNDGPPNLVEPRALAASVIPNNEPYVLYVTDPQLNTTLARWRTDQDNDAVWTPWSCFDSVVYPERISAINVYDRTPPDSTAEVYATNSAGRLFVRRFYKGGWAYWDMIGVPRINSHLTDVAASSTPSTLPTVYVLDEGRVFRRHHVAIQAYSNYTPWREVNDPPAGAVHLCAGVRTDQRQQLFVSTTNGKVYSTVQASTDPDSEFGAFEPVVQTSAPQMTDIDCGYLIDGTLTVFGLSSGAVWFLPSQGSSEWQPERMQTGLTFTVFTVGSFQNRAPTVFGLDSTNRPWGHLLGSTAWTLIQ
jgi:hypothetical protein